MTAIVCSVSLAIIWGGTAQRWMTPSLVCTNIRAVPTPKSSPENTIAAQRASKCRAAASTTASHTATGPAGAAHSAEEIRSRVSIVWSRRADLSRQAA